MSAETRPVPRRYARKWLLAALLLALLLQVVLVDVAHREELRPGVHPLEVAPAHAANADHRLGQLVARRRVARPAEDVTRYDGEREGRADRGLEESSPGDGS